MFQTARLKTERHFWVTQPSSLSLLSSLSWAGPSHPTPACLDARLRLWYRGFLLTSLVLSRSAFQAFLAFPWFHARSEFCLVLNRWQLFSPFCILCTIQTWTACLSIRKWCCSHWSWDGQEAANRDAKAKEPHLRDLLSATKTYSCFRLETWARL